MARRERRMRERRLGWRTLIAIVVQGEWIRWDRKRNEWELLANLTELLVLYRLLLALFLSVHWVNLEIYVNVAYVDARWRLLTNIWTPRRWWLSLIICGVLLLVITATVGVVHASWIVQYLRFCHRALYSHFLILWTIFGFGYLCE